MSEFIFDNQIKNQFDTLPKGWVFYTLSNAGTYLYSGYSANLGRKLKYLQYKADEGGIYAEFWSGVSRVSWVSCPDGMSALLRHKCFMAENVPEFQHRIMPWSEYAYLALDAFSFPFVRIMEHTNDDWLYLGPFRSRFFLADVIDIYSRILKLPACETGSYPCRKFDDQRCRGWCLSIAPSEESQHEHSLEKLDSLLKEAFVHPENGILELVQKERDNYFNELEFAKAELLDDEIELLGKYRDWLKFLYISKSLETERDDLAISKGRIRFCRLDGKEYHFPVDNTQFRRNETLALNLDSVDECRIVYEYMIGR